MRDNNTDSKKVQRQIERFAWRITGGFKKRRRRFVGQMLFGIQATRDVKISNVVRSLKERIRLIKTEN